MNDKLIRSNYDIYCMWDEDYIRRMKKEEELNWMRSKKIYICEEV